MMTSRAVRTTLRLYRGLLRLFPAAHRQRYGEELAQTARDMLLAAEARYGRRGLLRIWLAAVADLLINVPIEYISIWRERRTHVSEECGSL